LPDSKQTAAATQGKRMKLLFLMQIARQQTNGSCNAGQTYEAAANADCETANKRQLQRRANV